LSIKRSGASPIMYLRTPFASMAGELFRGDRA
jgi:hypothetical protein